MGERTLLPPARHTPINEARVALGAFRGAEAKTLHNAWPIALDQRIGRLDQRQRFLELFGPLLIKGDSPLSPPQRTFRQRPVGIAELSFARADDRDNVGAEIGQSYNSFTLRTQLAF